MLTLVARSLRRIAPLTGGVAAILSAFQFALVAVAAAYERAGSFGQLGALVPDFAQGHLGAALASFASMTTTGYFEPAVVMLIAQFAIHLGAEPAADVETGIADIVLAHPLPRAWIVTRTLIVVAVVTAALVATMGTSTWLGLRWLAPPAAPWPQAGVVLQLMLNLTAVALCFAAATLAASGWARRRAQAQAPLAVAAIAAYLVWFLAGWWTPIRPLARLSPFQYFSGAAILRGAGRTLFNVSVLGAATAVASAIAYWRFERRDM